MAHDTLIETDRYLARLVTSDGELESVLALRARVFRGDPLADDRDKFDPRCRHLVVQERVSGALLASCRLLEFESGARIATSYAAQFYGLEALAGFAQPLIEVGRFCIAPGPEAADVLRVAWAALTRIVDDGGVGFLFGCSSFPGTDPAAFGDAFALLRDRHLAPEGWRPSARAAGERVPFDAGLPAVPDTKRALKTLPPLLRTYLIMGGWVSDHAVIDRDLGTLHVFTGLEVAAVSPARARALRGLAGV